MAEGALDDAEVGQRGAAGAGAGEAQPRGRLPGSEAVRGHEEEPAHCGRRKAPAAVGVVDGDWAGVVCARTANGDLEERGDDVGREPCAGDEWEGKAREAEALEGRVDGRAVVESDQEQPIRASAAAWRVPPSPSSSLPKTTSRPGMRTRGDRERGGEEWGALGSTCNNPSAAPLRCSIT
jgi:hypothetical protein